MKKLFIFLILVLVYSCKNYKEDLLFSIPENLSSETLKKLGYNNGIDYPYYRKKMNDTLIIYETDSLNMFTDKAIFISLQKGNDSISLAKLLQNYNINIVSNIERKNENFKFFAKSIAKNYLMEVSGNKKGIVVRIPISK